MSFMPATRSWRQRLLFPALTLAAAGVLALLARPRPQSPESGRAVSALVESGLRGGPVSATEPLVRETLARRLAGVDPATLSVEVREGEPTDGASGATHHAIVSRDGRPFLLIRARYDPDPSRRALVGVTAIE